MNPLLMNKRVYTGTIGSLISSPILGLLLNKSLPGSSITGTLAYANGNQRVNGTMTSTHLTAAGITFAHAQNKQAANKVHTRQIDLFGACLGLV